jgi:hypothetical protein
MAAQHRTRALAGKEVGWGGEGSWMIFRVVRVGRWNLVRCGRIAAFRSARKYPEKTTRESHNWGGEGRSKNRRGKQASEECGR